MAYLAAVARGLTSTALFGVFGIGALLVSPVMLVLRRPERGQPVVRTLWRPMVALFQLTGLIRVNRGNLGTYRGAVLVANHPTLIDVMLIVSLVPRTLYVAKHALKTNPILAAIVRATALPDDATLPEKAADYLKDGWNVLVFPEGTRSPREGGLNPFHRGAAQLALRTGAPIVCLRERLSRRLLAKGQRPWDMGTRRVQIAFEELDVLTPPKAEGSFHVAAQALTENVRALFGSGDTFLI